MAGGGGTIWGMAKDHDINTSNNGSSSSNGTVTDLLASDAFIAAQQARFAETRAELAAEGVDSTKEIAELRAAAATWPE
jgi:hypothetical protein